MPSDKMHSGMMPGMAPGMVPGTVPSTVMRGGQVMPAGSQSMMADVIVPEQRCVVVVVVG